MCGFAEVSDEVTPVLLLLEAGEHHLGAGDVLLGVDEVLLQGVLAPGDTLVHVGLNNNKLVRSFSLFIKSTKVCPLLGTDQCSMLYLYV